MLKKTMLASLISLMAASVLPLQAGAAGNTVQVRITEFPVKVNGQIINNTQMEYPFLIYKDITYLPLNWDLLRELELSSEWSDTEGLKIYRTCCANDYGDIPALEKPPLTQAGTANNAIQRTYNAVPSSYPIEIRGMPVDNTAQTYPFLQFRDVTYMPLTWDLAHLKLMMDLQWSPEEGLSLWGGEDRVMQQIVYDDEESLYISTTGTNKEKTMLKVSKSLSAAPEWLETGEEQAIREKAEQSGDTNRVEGKEAVIERDGNTLRYNNMTLSELRDEEKNELGGTTLRIEGTLYDIDDRRKLLAVYTYYPIAVIGPPPHSRYQLFSIVDGKLKAVTEYPYLPELVLKNADGTVWIARDRQPFRNLYYLNSGLLALMDTDGSIRLANELWDEQDVSPVGIRKLTGNPVDSKGSLIVRLYGKPRKVAEGGAVDPSSGRFPLTVEYGDPEKDGLYEVDTSLQLKKLSGAPDPMDDIAFYRDRSGNVFSINRYSNTLTNWTKHESRTWTDKELLKQR